MKRSSWIVAIVLLALAGMGIWFWLNAPPPHYRAEELLPASTWAYVDIPDFRRSRTRFSESALGRILAEPEIRSFLQRPGRGALPRTKLGPIFGSVLEIANTCRGEVFAACTDIPISPRLDVAVLVGLDPRDQRKRAETLVEDLISNCRIQYPESQIEEREYEGVTYRVWIPFKNFTVAFGRIGNFLLFSHGEEPLQKAILCSQRQVEERLADVPSFQQQMARYPERDVVTFLNLDAVVGPLKPLATIQPSLRAGLDSLVPFRTYCGVATFRDGGVENHSAVTLGGSSAMTFSGLQPCERMTLRAAGANTLFYGATTLNLSDYVVRLLPTAVRSDPKSENSFLNFLLTTFRIPRFPTDDNVLADLGPETALLVDWKESQPIPSVSLVMQAGSTRGTEFVIRKFAKSIPQLVRAAVGAPDPSASPKTGSTGKAPAKKTVESADSCFAVSGSTIILAPSRETAADILDTLEGRKPRLEDQPEFQRVASRIGQGGVMFTYCDQRRLFERVYGIIQQIKPPPTDTAAGRIAAQAVEGVRDFLNLGKLPPSEKIASHLFPGVTSQWAVTNGYTKASFGPVDLPAVVFGIADLAGSEAPRTK
jgi:hypothetical protein